MCGTFRETHPEVRKLSGNTPGEPDLFGKLTRRSGTGRETLPEILKWSKDPSEGPEVVERPSRRPKVV